MPTLQALLGLVLIHAALFALSEDRRAVPWRMVSAALAVQFLLAVALTSWSGSLVLFETVNRLMQALQAATDAGTGFLFGYLAGGPAPFEVSEPGAAYILALRALPVIIVMSALARVLTHWGVLPFVIRVLSRVLERSLGIGGALGLASAANVFVGMIEAPLLVRPYLARMSRGELFALMGCGMATIAGTVFVLFANILAPVVPNAAGHLFTASLMSLPAAIAFCVLLIPPAHHTEADAELEAADANTFDAITAGTADGLKLYFNIVAMLLVLVALVHLLNLGLGLVEIAGAPLTLERMLGWLLAPLCWLLGVPAAEAADAGRLLGTKVVLNELIAYLELARLDAGVLSERTRIIMTYALCGFANLGSMGMLAGALSLMLPERRREVLELGLRSVAVGTLATCSTGAVIGVVG
ncbi:MAG: NupC/NupG family nucleoside CNT transporter [Gammaproteobacteria bacterium]